MRACLAILKDSFREAMASRILWIALLAIAAVLLAMAPLGLRTDRSLRVRQQELTDPEKLLEALSRQDGDSPTVARHLWDLMNTEQQQRVHSWLNETDTVTDQSRQEGRRPRSLRGQILREINSLLEHQAFYMPAAWKDVRLDQDTKSLTENAHSDDRLQKLRNLKLLAAAFPSSISLRDDPAVVLTYAGTDMTAPIDLLPSQLKRTIDGIIVLVLNVFLGFLGVFGSLLVTASVIPRTFEPGEISLLLSKPISRTVLFLTRFVGGCAFTLLCAGLLVSGVLLILGWRMEIWRPELLWCIPVYVFLFAVYFSVSAMAGVVWKNANVSLMLVVIFWIVLFTVGTARTIVHENIVRSRRIIEITAAGESLLAVDGTRSVLHWDANRGDWSEVFAARNPGIPQFMQRMMLSGTRMAPVYDPRQERILALQPEPSRFGGPAPATVVSGTADDDWERELEGRTPEPVIALLLDAEGRVLLPARRVIYEFTGQSEQQKRTQQFLGSLLGGLLKPTARTAFREVQTSRLPDWTPSATAALDASSGSLFVLDKGEVHHFNRNDDGTYGNETAFPLENNQPGLIAAAAGNVLVAFRGGAVTLLDASSLQPVATMQLRPGDEPSAVAAAPDGSLLAVLSHAGHLSVADTASQSFLNRRPSMDGRISAVSFNQQNRLLVANGRRTVIVLDSEFREVSRTVGAEDWVYTVYDWILNPLYAILPRPSDMDFAVRFLVTGERTVVSGEPVVPLRGNDQENLFADRTVFDIRRPLISNGLFIACLLTASCLYIARHDF